MVRRPLVLVVALLIGVQVVRNAGVAAFAQRAPDKAALIWPDHPDAQIALAMTEIGRLARQRSAVPQSLFRSIDEAAIKAPLAAEPFLVRGVQAQLTGNATLALRAFQAAERRDPRSLPAHYFLADALFHSGDSQRGLEEIGVLARLAPNGLASVAPYIAAYARNPATWPQLRELFRSNPEIEEAALEALAKDPSQADAVAALADPDHRGPKAIWLGTLLASLIDAGQYAKARGVWASAVGPARARGALLHDPHFTDATSPPPFNWALMSSTVGLAERQTGGRLHVIFYGREDGLLARQLLVLRPGSYRLTFVVTGNPGDAHSLTWSIRCDRSDAPLAAVPLDVAASRGWTFTVPSGCAAQWLELSGVSSDVPHQADVTLSKLDFVAGRPDG